MTLHSYITGDFCSARSDCLLARRGVSAANPKGTPPNRVSASKLYEIARSLQTTTSYFFDGFADPHSGRALSPEYVEEKAAVDFLMTPEGLEMAALFPRIPKGKMRRRVLDLVRAMSEEAE